MSVDTSRNVEEISPQPLFGAADAERANDEWGANCGPAALAAILHKTLDDIRPHMGDFEHKHYTNPTLMLASLARVGASIRVWKPYQLTSGEWQFPTWGLCRVQWEGPWTAPGVPIRARYRHTHWIGVSAKGGGVGIFDVNCLQNGSGWVAFLDWETMVVPWLLKACVPRANGKWHLTHAIEVTCQ